MGFYQQAPVIVCCVLDKAHLQADEIKKLNPTRGHQAAAGLYLTEKKYPEAFAEFDEVLKDRPDDYSTLYQIGRLAAVSGEQLDRGLAALQRCLAQTPGENQPGYAAVHWRIGNILEKKDDKPGARAAYEAALKIDPKFSQAAESLKKL
jgi:tetratricopeptide (TPR) repeat protein